MEVSESDMQRALFCAKQIQELESLATVRQTLGLAIQEESEQSAEEETAGPAE
jgi:hypothetical protein